MKFRDVFSASEIFHEDIRMSISVITGVMNIYDDLLTYGKCQTEHDYALYRLLQRLRGKGITANIKKCTFNVNEIDFFGMRFSSNAPRKWKLLKMQVRRLIFQN